MTVRLRMHRSSARVVLLAGSCLAALYCRKQEPAPPPLQEAVMPAPRAVAPAEQEDLMRALERFQARPPSTAKYTAAGPFRVVSAAAFEYLDRTDIGSVVYERADYGSPLTPFDSNAVPRAMTLSRVEESLARIGLDVSGHRFVTFQDEFAGAAPRGRGLSIQINPRRLSKHVARTAEFGRMVEDVPVFGSELLVGLMPDGSVGRFRRHWPAIKPNLVAEARALQEAVRSKAWTVPQALRDPDTEILDVTAGVGHSGIADPGFREAAVIRILYRRVSRDSLYPLSSTSYKYYDRSGQEVLFTMFPKAPESPARQKPSVGKP